MALNAGEQYSGGQVVDSNGRTVVVIASGGGGAGTVTSVTATDGSIVVAGTATDPTVATGTLDAVAAAHPPAAAWSNNSKKITSLANGSGAQDAAAFGQIPTALPPNGAAGGDLSGTFPNPTVANLNGVAAASYALKASPALTGTPTVPTAAASTNTTQAASTAYADAAVLVEKTRAQAAELTIGLLTADASAITSNTTLATITGLSVPTTSSATETWFVEWFLLVNSVNTTMDMKLGLSVTSGITAQWGASNGGLNSFGTSQSLASTTTPIGMGAAGGTLSLATISGTVGSQLLGVFFSNGNAGTINLQIAQNTSDAGALTVKAGSFVRYQKLRA